MKQITNYNSNPYNFNFLFQNTDNSLSEGTHYYSVIVQDELYHTVTDSSYFTLIYSAPVLDIKSNNYPTLKKNVNMSIQLILGIVDHNAPCELTINYELLNMKNEKSFSISSSEELLNTLSIEIPQNLQENNYTIYIWVSDKFHQSDRKSFDFKFEYNAPTISLSPDNEKTYYSDPSTSVIISGTVSDYDGTGTVTVKLIIEDLDYSSSKIITISDNNPHQFKFEINTRSYSFEEKRYDYKVVAYDEGNKPSSNELSYFQMNFLHPSFNIIEPKDKLIIRKNIDKSFKIKYDLTNHDYPCSMRFYYNINEGNISILDTIEMKDYELNNQIILIL